MRNLNLAECVLSLSTDPARASATVGDLAEQIPAHGSLWFWLSVVRTCASRAVRNLLEAPIRIARISFAAALIDLAAEFAFALLNGVMFFWVAFLAGPAALHSKAALLLWVNAQTVLVALLIGHLLSRWMPGREAAACFLYLILAPICDVVSNLGWHPSASFLLGICLTDVALRTPVFIGAVWVRLRRPRIARQ